ncbi:MAG: asparagine synthase C-terminal domain-containing protein [Nanoarchaeota archaeon]|nr:asparagine synthase C-terminal domain-containing protein [Nanoarchaeota archaeon]
METYLKNKSLIPEEEWFDIVDRLKTSVEKEKLLDKKEGIQIIKKELIGAVKKRIPKERFGIMFSGGVDSSLISLICSNHCDVKQFTCYSVGFKTAGMDTPPDLEYARRVADHLGVNLKMKIYDIDEAEKIIKEVVKMLPKPKQVDADFVVKVGVGSVILAVKKIAKENKFFSGLGSEEIFAGYDRHAKSSDINEECWRGLKYMWNRDMTRDCAIAKELSIDIMTPFLDENMIKEAMRVPGKYKLDKEQKKIILRYVAEDLGLEKEFAWRKKMGAQYGSRFDKAIDKLAKKRGYAFKKDYLQSLL